MPLGEKARITQQMINQMVLSKLTGASMVSPALPKDEHLGHGVVPRIHLQQDTV